VLLREPVANHKQAEKRNRQRIKRRGRNLLTLSAMRTYIKRCRKAIVDGELDILKATFPVAIRAISKAASKGVLHHNTAARYASRLTLAVQRATKS